MHTQNLTIAHAAAPTNPKDKKTNFFIKNNLIKIINTVLANKDSKLRKFHLNDDIEATIRSNITYLLQYFECDFFNDAETALEIIKLDLEDKVLFGNLLEKVSVNQKSKEVDSKPTDDKKEIIFKFLESIDHEKFTIKILPTFLDIIQPFMTKCLESTKDCTRLNDILTKSKNIREGFKPLLLEDLVNKINKAATKKTKKKRKRKRNRNRKKTTQTQKNPSLPEKEVKAVTVIDNKIPDMKKAPQEEKSNPEKKTKKPETTQTKIPSNETEDSINSDKHPNEKTSDTINQTTTSKNQNTVTQKKESPTELEKPSGKKDQNKERKNGEIKKHRPKSNQQAIKLFQEKKSATTNNEDSIEKSSEPKNKEITSEKTKTTPTDPQNIGSDKTPYSYPVTPTPQYQSIPSSHSPVYTNSSQYPRNNYGYNNTHPTTYGNPYTNYQPYSYYNAGYGTSYPPSFYPPKVNFDPNKDIIIPNYHPILYSYTTTFIQQHSYHRPQQQPQRTQHTFYGQLFRSNQQNTTPPSDLDLKRQHKKADHSPPSDSEKEKDSNIRSSKQ